MSLYVGINSKPKNIVGLLIGKNGSTTAAQTAYTGGVNSKSLVYNSFNLDKELTKVDPVKALASGKIKKSDIGKTVYLSNSISPCQEWIIADIDHDNTKGTVDIISKYSLTNKSNNWNFGSRTATGYNHPYYYASGIRESINNFRSYDGLFPSGFSAEIQNAIKVQDVPCTLKESLNSNVYDKIKLPSLSELGLMGDRNKSITYSNNEGTIYPLFGIEQSDANASPKYFNYTDGSATWRDEYWTRTTSIDTDRVATVSMNLEPGYYASVKDYYSTCALRCIMRF